MGVSGLVPARFLTITAQLVITIIILWSREENVDACVSDPDDYKKKDDELIIGLSISLGLFAIELLGFFGGLSMFIAPQALLSIAAHTGGTVSLAYFLFDAWPCDTYWWIFGFCCALPAVTEVCVWIGVICLNKGF